ncbi:tumor necrosis factor (ligand) superfamily, member 10 like 4 [Megalops cyprinoides]|uniref:tumor necrosis factor (ligand) superfamily, member 10 like 4 n=1 Tax=Megalops cyprinoides TaxID=118141 RepID=UPI0018647BD5|nr:tumor necrosis factor (ligand) superfamily, member 10 like 4 [Megalops cyprinoides]
MTAESQSHSYSQLKEHILLLTTKQDKPGKWNVFVLILSLVLGAEVFITTFLLYDLSKEINQVQEEARFGEYPLHCLHQLADPSYQENASLSPGGLASCDSLIHELRNSAHKHLISGIRNALHQELTANNITLSHSNKPVIHMGPEQELRQFPLWLKKDGEENVITVDNIRWDNINGFAVQQGVIGYSPDGEVVIHRKGLYFVYSQVYFQLLPSLQGKRSQPFIQYIYRKTASYQEPILLSKAVVTKCWNTAPDLQLFSSHQGALFQLQQGDKLSLQVTDIQAVRLQEESTFFGAFMIN